MTNGEKIIAVLNPRANQIRILGNWVEIEIQKSGINFSCGLDWWNAEYKEPTRKTCNSCGNFGSHNGVCDICNPKYNDLWREKPNCSENPTSSTTKNDLGVDCIVDVLGSYTDLDIPYKREIAENILTKLHSVTPQPRKGHWIPVFQGDEIIDYRCSCCEFGNTFGKGTVGMNYCPNCGSRNEVEK